MVQVRFGIWALVHGSRVAMQDPDEPDNPHSFMAQTMSKVPCVGSNGGTAVGLVGSYDTGAEGISQLNANIIELFILQFPPFNAEIRRFAAEVMPRLRE